MEEHTESPVIYIGGRRIGGVNPCYIIAEAGSNHNRDKSTAFKLIDIAVDAGADAVKFQTYSAETLYSKKTPTMSYIKNEKLLRDGETIWDLIKRIEMPREWLPDLARYCKEKDIVFLSSPFDLKAVEELESVNVAAYKIASFEITHFPLLKAVGETGKPIILSTGMADLSDIEEALNVIYKTGNKNVALLHCSISYPPKFEDLHLRAMYTMRQAFNRPVGYSDHTMDVITDVAAVANGACIIEKHFTQSRDQEGPDHRFAMEPHELKEMCEAIRNTEKALGSPLKKHTEAEQELYKLSRRSLVAACDITAGSEITGEMIAVKRPGYGIPTRMMDAVIGRTAKVDIEEDDILDWSMIG